MKKAFTKICSHSNGSCRDHTRLSTSVKKDGHADAYHLRALWYVAGALLLLILTTGNVIAQKFGAGNLVVTRVGTPGGTLTTGPNEAYVDEYTPSGVFVRSIPLPKRTSTGFRVVGYFSGSIVADSSKIRFSQLTHLNIAFINPDSTGTFPSSITGLSSLIIRAHTYGVKVLVALGGGGAPSYYTSLISPAKRASFITKIQTLISTYNLDGVDIDLENSLVTPDYEGFVSDLATAIKPTSLLSGAVATANGSAFTTTALSKFDYITVMSYDKTGPWNPANPGQHSPYSMTFSDLIYWSVTKGVSKDKINPGVPFYGYGFNGSVVTTMTYRKIVNTYAGAENVDQENMSGGGIMYYNGIPTIKAKTTLAINQTGGISIWSLTQDTTGSKSLLSAIRSVVDSSANNKQLTLSNSPDEGLITRSENGNYLVIAGYAKNIDGTTGLAATTSSSVKRSVAVLDINGMTNTATALSDYSSAASPKCAVTVNGSNLWLAGGAGGVAYAVKGASSISTTVSSTITDVRSIKAESGQLIASANSSGLRVATVGTGMPVTSGNIMTTLTGSAIANIKNPYQFGMADLSPTESGLDVMYVASQYTSTTSGGIYKFSKVSGTWVANGSFDLGTTKNYRGLACKFNDTVMVIYAIRNSTTSTGGELVKIIDSAGYNATFLGTEKFSISATTTPGISNAAFRSVAFAPSASLGSFAVMQPAVDNSQLKFTSSAYDKPSQAVKLSWKGQLKNGNYYSLMRSNNGVQYAPIGIVDHPDALGNYSLVDKMPLAGSNFYLVNEMSNGTLINKSDVVTENVSLDRAVVAGNIISPNGDGKNDTWTIKNIELYPKNSVTVYDKGGKIVFSKTGYSNDWNGTYNGSVLTEGTYYYSIDLNDGNKPILGFITILRSK